MSRNKAPKIRPIETYSVMSDAVVIKRATAVYTGLNGNSNFTNLPVALTDFKAQIDTVTALIGQAMDGSKKVIAEKNKQMHALIKMMRALGRYVELNCKDDPAIFASSGFEALANTIVIRLKAVAKAGSYQFRYGPSANGGLPTAWITKEFTSVKTPITLDGLTPGTIYAFDARALVGTQWTDYSDPVTLMCT